MCVWGGCASVTYGTRFKLYLLWGQMRLSKLPDSLPVRMEVQKSPEGVDRIRKHLTAKFTRREIHQSCTPAIPQAQGASKV